MRLSECIGGLSEHKWGGSQYHQQDRVYLMGDQALAMTAQIPRGSYLYMEVKKLGNIYGFTGGNFAGSVWDKEGIAPTISTMQGGGSRTADYRLLLRSNERQRRIREHRAELGDKRRHLKHINERGKGQFGHGDTKVRRVK